MSGFKSSGGGGGFDPSVIAGLVSDGELSAAEAAILAAIGVRATEANATTNKNTILAALSLYQSKLNDALGLTNGTSSPVQEFPADQVPPGWVVDAGVGPLPPLPSAVFANLPTADNGQAIGTMGEAPALTLHSSASKFLAWTLCVVGAGAQSYDYATSTRGVSNYGIPLYGIFGAPCEISDTKAWTGPVVNPDFGTGMGEGLTYIFDTATNTYTPGPYCLHAGYTGMRGVSVPLSRATTGARDVFYLPKQLVNVTSGAAEQNTRLAFIFDATTHTVSGLQLSGFPADFDWDTAQTTPAIAYLPSGKILLVEGYNAISGLTYNRAAPRYFVINPATGSVTTGTASTSALASPDYDGLAAAGTATGAVLFNGMGSFVYDEAANTFSPLVRFFAGRNQQYAGSGRFFGRALPFAIGTFYNEAGAVIQKTNFAIANEYAGVYSLGYVLNGLPQVGTVKAHKPA